MMTTPTLTSQFDELTKAMQQHEPLKLELFRLTLAAAVPGCIADLQRIGGPSDWHFEQASQFSSELGVKGETARMMARFCEVVAILAFVPGGVSILGLHFEASTPDESEGEI